MTISIHSTLDPSPEDIEFLYNGIYEEAKRQRGMSPHVHFGFLLKDDKGDKVGGLNGFSYYGCLYMDQLYISENYRGLGWGTKLVRKAEEFGIAKECKMFMVTTMDWEARGFYEKLGYHNICTIDGYENNAMMYLLRKRAHEIAHS